MRWRLIPLLLVLASCGRPLTEAERAFLSELQPGLDPAPIRIVEMPLVGLRSHSRPVRPRVTCRERIFPPPAGPTVESRAAGVAMYQHIWVTPDYYLEDYLEDYPSELPLVAAMFFAHEMTHVWQWQNRAMTRYHPLRGASEHWVSDDPYLFDITQESRDFLSYGYEQQASLVEEYVCCRALDPAGARTARLEDMLAPYLDLSPLNEPLSRPDVRLPWAGVEVRDICS